VQPAKPPASLVCWPSNKRGINALQRVVSDRTAKGVDDYRILPYQWLADWVRGINKELTVRLCSACMGAHG
jgi:hypothetical protein